MAPKTKGSKRKRSTIPASSSTNFDQGLRLRDANAETAYVQIFQHKTFIGNGTVDWSFFDENWPEVCHIFDAQGWKSLFGRTFLNYPFVVKSLYANMDASVHTALVTWYDGKVLYITSNDVNAALGVVGDNLLEMRDRCKPFEGFDTKRVWATLTNRDLSNFNVLWGLPTLDSLLPLAKILHRIIVKVIEPSVKRNHLPAHFIWLIYNLIHRNRINLGSLVIDQFFTIFANRKYVIRNPGWLICVLENMGYNFSNTMSDSLKGVVVNKGMVKKTFTFQNGVWVNKVDNTENEEQPNQPRQSQPKVQIPPNVGGGLMDDTTDSGSTSLDDLRRSMVSMNILIQQGFASQHQEIQSGFSIVNRNIEGMMGRLDHQERQQRRSFENMSNLRDGFVSQYPNYVMPPFLHYEEPSYSYPMFQQYPPAPSTSTPGSTPISSIPRMFNSSNPNSSMPFSGNDGVDILPGC